MPLFLGIYHKQKALSLAMVQPMIDAFGGYAHRYLTQRHFPGFLFVSANEQQNETVFSDGTGMIAGLVGTLAVNGNASTKMADSLLEAWQERAITGLAAMEGAFTGAVYDPTAHRLVLVNDKFGMRPLFVCETAEYVAFCNEWEPLLKTPGFQFVPDLSAIAAYFCLGTTLGAQTFAEGIRNLPPGTVLQASGQSVQESTYWEANLPIDRTATIEEHAARIVDVMRTVVPQLLDQLTNVACLLSAGADSRLILSCALPRQRLAVPWLTSRLSILAAEEDKDVIGAKALAARLGLEHEVMEMAFSELEFGPAYFDQVRNNRWKKIVGGWHGGEFLGGFCSLAAPIRKTPSRTEVEEKLQQVFSRRFRRQLGQHPFDVHEAARGAITAENQDFYFQIQQFGRGFFTNIYQGSRGHWLQPYEIVNQGFSPFWDSRFLQALLQVPFEMVAGYQLYNVIFRDHLRELTDIPSNSPLTLRPDSSLQRMTEGTDPKVALKAKYQQALAAFAADRRTWRRRMYRRWRMRKSLGNGDAPSTMQFIDFEAWWRRYVEAYT
jgi:hypothetical protein